MDNGERQDRDAKGTPLHSRTRHHGLGMDYRLGTTNRRVFLRTMALGTAGAVVGPRLLWPGSARGEGRGLRTSKIVRAYHPGATTDWDTVNQVPVDLMVHAAVKELTGIANTADAWKSLFPGITASHTVGVKINLACGDVPTHPEVVNAIIDGLRMMDLGGLQLPEENIIIWDFDDPFFCAQTGYVPNWGGPGVQYVGTSHASVGHDMTQTFTINHPLNRTTDHHPSRIITDFSDYLINVPVIKDHSDSDVTMCLKNNYGSFDGVNEYEMHVYWKYGDGHTRGEPELNRVLRDELGDKTKLFLVDGTFGLFEGGPGYTPPGHTPPNWAYNSVIAGFDPVAVDRIGTEKINEKRTAMGYGVLDPSHVSTSALDPYNLGTDDPAEIDLVEIDASSMGSVEGGWAGPLPEGMILLSPYPNPARGACTLRFSSPGDADVDVLILDVRGRLVRRVASGRYSRGVHHLAWDGTNDRGRPMPSGVYFCRLNGRGAAQQRRVVLVR